MKNLMRVIFIGAVVGANLNLLLFGTSYESFSWVVTNLIVFYLAIVL